MQWRIAYVRTRKLSVGRIFPKAEFFRKPNLSEYLPNVPKCGLNTRHDNRELTWSDTYSIFLKPNLSEYLLNVPKCGLNTRHYNGEVTLIHLTRALTLRSDKCATGSIHKKGLMTINAIPCWLLCRSGLCLVPSVIHLRFKLQATIIFAGITIHWALRKIFWKFFVYLMMTNVMMKRCLNQKIIKNSNLIQAMKSSVCPKPKVILGANFCESRICTNIYRNVPSCGLNAWQDNREVTLIHLTGAQTLRSDKCATCLIHANGSMTINAIPC